jgi:hypothetical protein
MGEIIVKNPTRKITHPTDDPMWERKKKIAEKNIKAGKLKFENEADERDYRRRVNASKFNVYGTPAFYPSDKIKPLCVGDLPDMTEEDWQKIELEKKRIEAIKDIDLFCIRCEKVTSHSISPEQSFCHDCGKQRPDYCKQYDELIQTKE